MGIGNLNNNFGKLTAKTSINNVNAEQINKTELAKTEKAGIAGSLNSATLKVGEGEKFDSDKVFDDSTTPKMKPAKGGGKTSTVKGKIKNGVRIALNIVGGLFAPFGFPNIGDALLGDQPKRPWDPQDYSA